MEEQTKIKRLQKEIKVLALYVPSNALLCAPPQYPRLNQPNDAQESHQHNESLSHLVG